MFYAYIVSNKRNGTLYTGHSDDVFARAEQHRNKTFSGFSARYGCVHLVWYEEHDTREAAFTRERQIKKWNRAWKLALIERSNPHWIDIASAPQWPLPQRAEFSDLRT